MRTFAKLPLLAAALSLLPGSISAPSARAEELVYFLSRLTAPVDAIFHRQNPAACEHQPVELLAQQIDWVEHHIDTYGTVVAKHPDVWGEARLMKHRHEYEEQLARELTKFGPNLNAAISRSDQAFLASALALQGALGGAEKPPTTKEATEVLSITQQSIGDPSASGGGNNYIERAKPFELGKGAAGLGFPQTNLSIEPTIYLDQLSRYLNHLHELRRINEGDDTADSPGYSLNLVRVPVSVLPGRRTRKGYGAEITVTATPYLGRDLLPVTFRNLVVNDLVDQLAYPMTRVINSDNKVVEYYLDELAQRHFDEDSDLYIWETFAKHEDTLSDAPPSPQHQRKPENGVERLKMGPKRFRDDLPEALIQRQPKNDKDQKEAKDAVIAQMTESLSEEILSFAVPASRSRRARQALPPSQLLAVYDLQLLAHVAADAKRGLQGHPANQCRLHLMDIRAFLQEELQAAYEFLAVPERQSLWGLSNQYLASAVRRRCLEQVRDVREQFLVQVGLPSEDHRFWDGNTTMALAWAILVESALLNERLIQDIKEVSSAKGCCIGPVDCLQFCGPDPCEEARLAFNQYVMCRWPIRVFALDPVTQEQNVADAFARRRELQLALSLAFAGGKINAQSMTRYVRRLEWDMATIALNRTAVGFSHGDNTFGWRFFPRFQTPPIKGNVAAFGETLFGGPTRDQDMRQRELEPGMRECVAIVVMPSFVPYVTFDTRSNWFRLTNPKQTEISMRDTVELSRSIKCMQQLAYQAADTCNLYRDGEVGRLLRRVEQLDRELPLQTMLVQVPHENTVGGFEMFNRGITELSPELIGWYGAPGINRNDMTTMFLVGDGFSVHDTRVIAGGRPVDFRLLSRQVMQVEIPTGLQALDDPSRGQLVDVHLATPYGISSHLLIPVAELSAMLPARHLAWQPGGYHVTFLYDPKRDAFTDDGTVVSLKGGRIAIVVPKTVTPPKKPTLVASVRYRDCKDDICLGSFTTSNLLFDARSNRYVLIGTELDTFLQNVNDKVKPYLQQRIKAGDAVPASFQIVLLGEIRDTDQEPLPIAGYLNVGAAFMEKLPAVTQ